jgi:hypothetical protein
MAINTALMLVVTILSSKYRWADRACKVVNVVLPVKRGNVRSTEGTATLMAQKVEATKVIGLAQRILTITMLIVYRKELGCYYLATVL